MMLSLALFINGVKYCLKKINVINKNKNEKIRIESFSYRQKIIPITLKTIP